jgi:hypothetical protein
MYKLVGQSVCDETCVGWGEGVGSLETVNRGNIGHEAYIILAYECDRETLPGCNQYTPRWSIHYVRL